MTPSSVTALPLVVREYRQGRALCMCGCGREATIASVTSHKHGWIKGKPRFYVRGHATRKRVRWIEEDRGYDTPCWLWQLSTDGCGYGMLTIQDDSRRGYHTERAHRHEWEKANGPIPDGLQLDHLCRVRNCVNPDHLEPVTNAENQRRGNCAILTEAKVLEIIALRGQGTRAEIAALYGVKPSTVKAIWLGRLWRHLPRPPAAP